MTTLTLTKTDQFGELIREQVNHHLTININDSISTSMSFYATIIHKEKKTEYGNYFPLFNEFPLWKYANIR